MLSSAVICSLLFVASAYGSGQLTVLHHPESLKFNGHNHVKESILPEVYSAALGFSTEHYSNWDGLYIQDPFNLPEALVTIAVDGIPDVGQGKGHHFPIKTDDDEADVYSTLEKRVIERYPEGSNQLVRIDLAEGLEQVTKHEIFEKVKHEKPLKHIHGSFKNSVDEDREFLKEIGLLNDIANSVERNGLESDGSSDVFWFKVNSLHPLADLYGENSTQVKDAKQLLNNAALALNNAFSKAYKGRVLVSIIASDAVHTRRSRSILEAADEPTDDLNLAKHYNKDYPAIFNIILWFGVAMFFSLLAICIAIGSMDPGRDSIIYRMTNTRLKKDI